MLRRHRHDSPHTHDVEICDTILSPYSAQDLALDALFHARFPDGFVCPCCGSRRATWLEKRALWQCRDCRRQTSLTAATAFAHTKLRPSQLLIIVDGVRKGLSAREIMRRLCCSYETAWRNLHKVRRALHRLVPHSDEIIGEVEIVVPIEALRGEGSEVGLTFVVDKDGRVGGRLHPAPISSTWNDLQAASRCGIFLRWLKRVFRGVSRKYLRRYLEAFLSVFDGAECLQAAMTAPHCSAAFMHHYP